MCRLPKFELEEAVVVYGELGAEGDPILCSERGGFDFEVAGFGRADSDSGEEVAGRVFDPAVLVVGGIGFDRGMWDAGGDEGMWVC